MDRSMTRRRFLSTSALAGALAGAGTLAALMMHRTAWAFTVAPANAEAQRLYLEACSTKDGVYHRELVAEVKARLQGSATDEQIEAAIAATSCPVCGCPITAS
jgi:hypothetical protein